GTVTYETQNVVTQDIRGIIVHVPIILKPAGVLPNADIVMHYDTTYLSYQWSETQVGRVVDIPGETWKGRSKLHFSQNEMYDTLLGYSVFKFYPIEIVGTTVRFDSLSFVGKGKNHCGQEVDTIIIANNGAKSIVTNSAALE